MLIIRILFVIDGMEYGGGERVFVQLAAGLRDRFEVSVASMSGGTFEQQVKQLGIKFYPVDMSRQFSLKPIRQLREIILTQETDLLHSQGARADFFSRIAGRITGRCHIICTIATMVERFNVGSFRKRIYLLIDSLTERYVEKFIVVSNSLKNVLIQRRKLPSSKIVRVYNGIELDKYRQEVEQDSLRNEWGISKEVPLVGAIGRMVWEKGFKYLIEAVPEIVRVIPETMFLLIGEGPLKRELEYLAERLKIKERVIFTGFRSDIKEILSAVDLLVVPSLLEGFPMVTLEAMAMAKLIVATRIDGITEQIKDGVDGILVPPKDPFALAKTVIRILNDKE
ncbi:MAG: glycosyltransferase, partial [candidate division WOR-3 bacterium]|nr:glycosyltransferase [candidate division WOR-3 bacterium]